MATDDNSGVRPAGPVVLRIKLRYENLDAMVQRFAPNAGKSGLFLPTRALQPVGTDVKFELRLADDTPVLVGLGRVRETRAFDSENPRAAFGISIALMRVSREGREVIMRMLERRRELGLPDVVIPLPDDIDEGRRIQAESSGVVRETHPQIVSAPVVEQVVARGVPRPVRLGGTTPPRDQGGVPAPIERAPRSGPVVPIPALAEERTRAPRPRLAELIDKAAELSGQAAVAIPELDEQVDVERALARARALASGADLDGELAALRESAATPVTVDVEAASAELAAQLGGKAIRKADRSARWAPPPEAIPIEARFEAVPAVEAAPVEIRSVESAPLEIAATPGDVTSIDMPTTERSPITEVAVPALREERRAESPSLVPREAYVIRKSDRIGSPYVASFDAEATGEGLPSSTQYSGEEQTRVPTGDDDAVAQPPASVILEEDPDLAAFEAALDAARIHTGVSAPAPTTENEDEDDDELATPPPPAQDEADESLEALPDGLMAQLDEQLAAAGYNAPSYAEEDEPVAAPYAYGGDESAPASHAASIDDDEEIEELDDMDVVEIDEDDEDLLNVRAEPVRAPESPPVDAPVPRAAAMPIPDDDFASRLDLGDDDEPTRDPYAERSAGYGAPSYRAGRNLSFRPHDTGEEFDEPHRFPPEPQILRQQPAEDLEQALSTLDVDLDPSLRRAVRATPASGTARPLPGLPLHRPSTGEQPTIKKRSETDDGIMIDFDDDD